MPSSRWETRLAQLRRDNRSGAEEIAGHALLLLGDAVADSVPSSVIPYRNWLLRTCRQLLAAQPSMGMVFRLVNDLLWAVDDATSAQQIRNRAIDFMQEYRGRADLALQALTENTVSYLPVAPVVMTYSRSSTVLRVLERLAERGRKIHVYCSESRPMLEGQTLASELSWLGVNVTIGVDMALFGWMSQVNVLLVGADSLSSAGLVNKIGTAELVRAAVEWDIPRVVVCSSFKFLPNDYMVAQGLRPRDPEEIMPIPSENVTVRNDYHDITPLEMISTVISEKGPLNQEELAQELAQVRTYPGLRGR
jgi:translation initiation factor 2B subunit (eIF-2B alpha/beta/delta family)